MMFDRFADWLADWLDWICFDRSIWIGFPAMLALSAALMLAMCAVVVVGVGTYHYVRHGDCLRSHQQAVNYPGYVLPIMVGTIMVPVWQPAHTAIETVCDEWERP